MSLRMQRNPACAVPFGWGGACVLYFDSMTDQLSTAVLLSLQTYLQVLSLIFHSWMVGRNTTRVEDQAYCMLGLFGISMPLLYGEGLKAFDRLQAILLQSSNDETIFAWDLKSRDSWRLLAQNPGHFAQSARVRPVMKFRRNPYSITNQGLRFEFTRGIGVQERDSLEGRRVLEVELNATADPHHQHLCLMHLERATCGHYIRRRDGDVRSLEFVRYPQSYDEVIDTPVRHRYDEEPSWKRAYPDPRLSLARERSSGEGTAEVIFIHMGQEHHTACRLSSGDYTYAERLV